MKKKEEVYVQPDSKKKAEKLQKLLDMFGQNVYRETYASLKNGELDEYYPLVHLHNTEWCRNTGRGFMVKEKTQVSIKELRNILAAEYLKPNDVVIASIGKIKCIVEVESINDKVSFIDGSKFSCINTGNKRVHHSGSFNSFIRYATEEEKALLNPVKELEVGKWYKAFIDTYNGYLFAMFNGYNVSTYGIHPDNNGEWFPECNWFSDFNIRDLKYQEATQTEIESALIAEAKKRYKVGSVASCLDNIEQDIKGSDFIYSGGNIYTNGESHALQPHINLSGYLYKGGQWAEVVSPATDKPKLAESHTDITKRELILDIEQKLKQLKELL